MGASGKRPVADNGNVAPAWRAMGRHPLTGTARRAVRLSEYQALFPTLGDYHQPDKFDGLIFSAAPPEREAPFAGVARASFFRAGEERAKWEWKRLLTRREYMNPGREG